MLSLKSVLRGAFTRFFPAGTLLLLVGVIPLVLSGGTGVTPYAPLISFLYTGSATVGYVAVLMIMRRRLSADAPVNGRPSIVAGAVSPVAIMLGLMAGPHPGIGWISAIICAIVGGALAVAMFFPWLARRVAGPLDLVVPGERRAALPTSSFSASTKTYSRSYAVEEDDRDA